MKDLNYELSRNQYSFVCSEATIVVLIGPQGEGKTFVGAVAMMAHAHKFMEKQRNMYRGNLDMVEPLRGVIIRDSLENIKRHMVPSIKKALPMVEFRDDFKRLLAPGLDVTCMGLGETGDLAKLQYGAEYGFGWLEEPAPMIERGSAGLSRDVFEAALARCARQSGADPRIQVTMNPPEEDHWTYTEFYETSRFPNKDFPDVTIEVFHMPYGENTTLTQVQRQMAKAAWAKNPALWRRFVEGKPAFTMIGESVTPEYNEDIHRTPRDVMLEPIDNVPCFRFWDGGLNPTCVFMQIRPSGHWAFLDTCRGTNIGAKQLIRSQVVPLLASRYSCVSGWRDIGDPSMCNREQSNSDYSAARIIEQELNTRFEPGIVPWHPRKEAIKQALQWMIDGNPMIQVSHHEGILHRALRGGWHYPENVQGKILRDKPLKDIHSHPGDAFSYGIEKLFGRKTIDQMAAMAIEQAEKGLVLSYA